MNEKMKKEIRCWRERVGYDSALDFLIRSGASRSSAQKILAGSYPNTPTPLLMRAISDAMKVVRRGRK